MYQADSIVAITGRAGEEISAGLVRSDGASVIALCRIEDGGAPSLEFGSVRSNLVLPDLQVFNWKLAPELLSRDQDVLDVWCPVEVTDQGAAWDHRQALRTLQELGGEHEHPCLSRDQRVEHGEVYR